MGLSNKSARREARKQRELMEEEAKKAEELANKKANLANAQAERADTKADIAGETQSEAIQALSRKSPTLYSASDSDDEDSLLY